jgi:hypothetical protein
MAVLPNIGGKPGNLTVALEAKKDAAASASRVSSAPKYLFTRAGRALVSVRIESGGVVAAVSVSSKYVRRAPDTIRFAAFVKLR